MKRSYVVQAAVLSLLVVLMAPVEALSAPPGADDRAECVHPHPCPDDGDVGAGPFELKEVIYERLEVPADWTDPEGPKIELEGWIGIPDVPDGVRVPVALNSTPYLGDCYLLAAACDPTPDDATWWADPDRDQVVHPWAERSWGVAPIALVRRGIAAAFFAVRGTGTSGGCLNHFGLDEQRDQAFLVEWLGGRSWSNGRVAMGGISAPAVTAWEAAVQAPEALKAIVTSGIVSDFYTLAHTPQGAHRSIFGPYWALWATSTSVLPPPGSQRLGDHIPSHGDRVCEDVVEMLTTYSTAPVVDDRNDVFFAERRLIDRFDDVTAAVLLAQGFDDIGHAYQDSAAWAALKRAPKRQVVGHWGHAWPTNATFDASWSAKNWTDLLFSWLDYWLKGTGPAPERLGRVDYQDDAGDDAGTWRSSNSWPPKKAADEVLYLAGSELAATPTGESRSFVAAPTPVTHEYYGAEVGLEPSGNFPTAVLSALCTAYPDANEQGHFPESVPGVDPSGLAYISEPLAEDSILAGNPFALLRLSSDQPGGIVGVHVLSLDPDFDCSDSSTFDVLAFGAADLRFHEGNLIGKDFPVGKPTEVRVDVWDNARRLLKDSRVAVVVSFGEVFPTTWGSAGQPYAPRITVHGDGGERASHVVLPITEGSAGGTVRKLEYPPRPFAGQG